MTLIELLEVVPDNYPLGLMDSDPDNYSIMSLAIRKISFLDSVRELS